MKVIFKYLLNFNITDVATLDMPSEYNIVACALQGDIICIWAEVDVTSPHKEQTFTKQMTGHPYSEKEHWRHIKTLHHPSGIVSHIMHEVL